MHTLEIPEVIPKLIFNYENEPLSSQVRNE